MRGVTVFATSDLHAHWVRGGGGGIAGVAAHIRAASGESTVWVDNGDTLSGSPLGAFLAGRGADHPVLPFLEECGMDAAVPGNHDFDHGAETLARRAGALRRAAYVCANAERADGTPLFPASVVLDRGGVRIGVVGAVTGHVQRLSRYEAVAGVRFTDPVAPVAAEAARLRPLVDVLLVSYHGGFEADPATGRATQYDTGEDQGFRLLREVPGLDGLIAGHQHRVAAGVAGTVAYVQPGYAGEGIGVLRFTVADGRVTHRTAEVVVPGRGAASGARGSGVHGVDGLSSGLLSSDALPSDALPSGALASGALAREDAAARRWLDQPSGLDADAVHRVVAARTGVARTALLLPERLTWGGLAAALPGPYGVERYRLPRTEAVAALAALPPGASTRGLSPATLPDDVDLVASTSLRGVLPAGRVQDARPCDWLDELVVTRPGHPGTLA